MVHIMTQLHKEPFSCMDNVCLVFCWIYRACILVYSVQSSTVSCNWVFFNSLMATFTFIFREVYFYPGLCKVTVFCFVYSGSCATCFSVISLDFSPHLTRFALSSRRWALQKIKKHITWCENTSKLCFVNGRFMSLLCHQVLGQMQCWEVWV